MDILKNLLGIGDNIKSFVKDKANNALNQVRSFGSQQVAIPKVLQKPYNFMATHDPVDVIIRPIQGALTLNQAHKVKNPVLRTAAEIGQGIVNTPANIFKGFGDTAQQINKSDLRKSSDWLKIAGNAGTMATDMASLVYGGGTAKNVASQAFAMPAKKAFSTVAKQGFIQGAKPGALFGLGYGVSQGLKEGENVHDQLLKALKEGATQTAAGLVLGGGLGAGIASGGLLAKKGIQEAGSFVKDLGRLKNPYSKVIVNPENWNLREGQKVPMTPNAVSREAVTLPKPGTDKKLDRFFAGNKQQVFIDTVKEPFKPESATFKFLQHPKAGLGIEDVTRGGTAITPKLAQEIDNSTVGMLTQYQDIPNLKFDGSQELPEKMVSHIFDDIGGKAKMYNAGDNVADQLKQQFGSKKYTTLEAIRDDALAFLSKKSDATGGEQGITAFVGRGGKFDNMINGTDELGKGSYFSRDKNVAQKFGDVTEVKLNLKDSEILKINNQADLDQFVKEAIRQYPDLPVNEAQSAYAKGMGYKAIEGASSLDELAGINVIDPSIIDNGAGIAPPKVMTSADLPNAGQKQSGFQETVQNTPGTPPDVAYNLGNQKSDYYNVLTNKEVVDRISPIIQGNEQEALRLARTDSTDGNAAAMLLIDKFIKSDRFEEANTLIREVSPRFTDQGQKVQILSLYGRLTPTGAIKFAQRLIDDANNKLPTGRKISMSKESVEQIAKLSGDIQQYQEGTREYAVAVAKLLDKIGAQVPPSIGQKIATIQTMAQLLNPKTAIRNLLGNGLFAALDNVSDVVGTGIDKVIAAKTGQRSVAMPNVKLQFNAGKEGLKLGLEDALLGIDTGTMGTQYDLPNRTFREGFLGKLETALNVELRATDRAFYTAAYKGSLDNQMRAAGVSEPTAQIMERAHYEALYRTFQDDSALATFLSGSKRLLNMGKKFGLGDFILKYPKTPGNLVSRGLDYSPIGFAKGIFNAVRPMIGRGDFNQRQVVQDLSRAFVGSGAIAAGFALAKAGIITGSPEKDSEIAATQRSEGQSPFTINLSALKRYALSGFNDKAAQPVDGDILASYDWLQPTAIQLSMGANAALNPKSNKKDLISGEINTALESLQSGIDTLTGQPVIKQFTDFYKTVGDQARGGAIGALKDVVTNAPASFVPSILNQTGQLFDNTSRDTYDPSVVNQAINKIETRVPGLRNTLQPRIDVWGDEQQMYKLGGNNVFNVFLNPSFLSKYVDRPEASLVMDIFQKSGETQQAPRFADKTIKINGEDRQLQPEEIVKYQTYLGENTKEAFSRLAEDKGFALLPDEEKAKRMGNILSDINSAAKYELFGNDPKNLSKGAKSIILKDYGRGGQGENGAQLPEDISKTIYLYDLQSYTEPNSKTGIKKYTFENEKLNVARQIFGGSEKYKDVPEDQKPEILKAMGFDPADVEYDYVASQTDASKSSFVLDELQNAGLDHNGVIQALVNGRKQSLSGKMVVSNGVVDEMYNQGLITSAERTALKKMKVGANGQVSRGATGGAKKGSKTSVASLVSALKKSPIDAKSAKTASGGVKASSQVKVPTNTVNPTLQTSVKAPAIPRIDQLIQANKAKFAISAKSDRKLSSLVRGGGGSTSKAPVKLSQSFYRGGRA